MGPGENRGSWTGKISSKISHFQDSILDSISNISNARVESKAEMVDLMDKIPGSFRNILNSEVSQILGSSLS